MESLQIWSFFWSVFSCIRTEYGEILRISPYSVRVQEIRTGNNFVFGHFSRSGCVSKKKDNSSAPKSHLLFSEVQAIKFIIHFFLIWLRFLSPKNCEIILTKQPCFQSINPTFPYVCMANIIYCFYEIVHSK